ncbi:MAG: hypothetical protein IT436_01325 [Phycisphaerales bacterium]|nr:hypothetical protein [Phycisphaerales bacterium]
MNRSLMNRMSRMNRMSHLSGAVLIAAAAGAASAQPLQFHRTVGLPANELAYEISPTSDRGFVTVGRTSLTPTTPADIYVVRYDSLGNDLWSRVIGSVDQANDVGYSIRQTRDGGYIIGAETSSISNRLGIALIKLSPAGGLVWSRVYTGVPFVDSPAGVELTELPDGSIVLVGRAQNTTGGPLDGVLLRTDPAGNPIFINRYQEVGAELDGASMSFSDIAVLSDGYMIAGWMNDAQGGNRQSLILKTTPAGVPVWARTYAMTGTDLTADALLLAPNAAAFCGREGAANAVAARIDLAGAPVWSRIIAGFRPGFSAAYNDNDELALFAGRTTNPVWGALIRFDPLGVYAGGVRYGDGDSRTEVHDVIGLPCGYGYALAGMTTMQPGSGQEDVHFPRTDTNGRTGCREQPYTPGITFPDLAVKPRTVQMIPDQLWETFPVFVQNPDSGNFRLCFDAGCPADLNGDGMVDFTDYLEFLNLYDAGSLCADFNGDGMIDFGDYLEFLNHYDAGC